MKMPGSSQKGKDNWEKLPVISPFPAVFSKDLYGGFNRNCL